MAPGIMILAASVPHQTLPGLVPVNGSVPSSPEAATNRPPRPESPGGYFTLSDSDGASGTGNETFPEEEPHQPKQSLQMYKIFRSPGNKALSESPPRTIVTSKADTSLTATQRSRSETPPRKPILTRESSLRHSKTPPRPSPPKSPSKYRMGGDDDTPPRPPPPLSYTSTLPPPVPKKLGRSTSGTSNSTLKRNDATSRFVSVVTPTPRPKPLQRVQPLQVQSPSVIKMLTAPSFSAPPIGYSSSSSEENAHSSLESGLGSRPALPKKKSPPPRNGTNGNVSKSKVRQSHEESSASSFLKTFQKATGSRRSSTESLSSAGSSVQQAKVKPSPNRKSSPPKELVRKPSFSKVDQKPSTRVIAANDITKARNTTPVNNPKQVLQRKSSSPELSSSKPVNQPVKRSSSQASNFSQTRPVVRTSSTEKSLQSKSQTESLTKPRPPVVRRSSSSCFSSSDTDSSKKLKSVPPPVQRKTSNSSIKSVEGPTSNGVRRSLSNSSSLSEVRDRKNAKSTNVAHVEPTPKKPSLSESFAASEKVQRIKKAVALTRTNSESRTPKPETKPENRPNESVQTRLKNSIHSLIKFYETNTHHKKSGDSPVVLEDKTTLDQVFASVDDGRSVCTNTTGHLSQLSQLSAERLQSWLSNPLPSMDSKDFSLVEVDVLDQYVTDMLSFTKGALSEIDTPRNSFHPSNIHLKSNEELLDLLNDVHQSEDASLCLKISVQDMISRIEADSKTKQEHRHSQQQQQQQQQHQPVIMTQTENPPSEEDLNRGVFTEVSFAGTFATQKLPQKLVANSNNQTKLVIDNKRLEVQQPVKNVILEQVKTSQPEIPAHAPVPSPRLKKKARKEQMLQEHKEKGKEALSLLVKQIQHPAEDEQQQQQQQKPQQEVDGGLNSLLDDLCAHSAGVVRDIAEDRRLSRSNLVHNSKENINDKVLAKKSEHQKVGTLC